MLKAWTTMNWYQTAYDHALWVDFQAYGRILATDRDRLELMNRISTNKLINLPQGVGVATLFLTATARILDYVVVLNQGEQVLIITQPNRHEAFLNFLRRNIFWNDRLQLQDITTSTRHIALIGKQAQQLLSSWWPEPLPTKRYDFSQHQDLTLVYSDTIAEAPSYWIIAPENSMTEVFKWLEQNDVPAAEFSAYDALRIEAGLPLAGHELTEDYIPLEIGLWDTISFNKGCYTGQEIIARMDSRGKLAKMMVRISTDTTHLTTGQALLNAEGRIVGEITSVAQLPTTPEKFVGLAVVKATEALASTQLYTQQGESLNVVGLAGVYESDYL
ncbi:MAG: hypothetical protein CUN55_06550 [Phototrophicales bacterium]|nr:MAG: hypothetical protein CUN55_06550 [Phototrophicales bacterium]